jgi:hypothetical protein
MHNNIPLFVRCTIQPLGAKVFGWGEQVRVPKLKVHVEEFYSALLVGVFRTVVQ